MLINQNLEKYSREPTSRSEKAKIVNRIAKSINAAAANTTGGGFIRKVSNL